MFTNQFYISGEIIECAGSSYIKVRGIIYWYYKKNYPCRWLLLPSIFFCLCNLTKSNRNFGTSHCFRYLYLSGCFLLLVFYFDCSQGKGDIKEFVNSTRKVVLPVRLQMSWINGFPLQAFAQHWAMNSSSWL